MADAIKVTIVEAKGSTQRDAGTTMVIDAEGIEGTIGGGALEWEAMAIARTMLDDGRTGHRQSFPLGPALGQCCGGAVTLTFEAVHDLPKADKPPVWIWGAGHVGRALIHTLSPLPVALTWIDDDFDRFPAEIPKDIHKLIATDMPRAMAHAPVAAHHLILTYSHEIDLSLCHAALAHDFASTGLIGSATKWARFQKRLRQLGHSDAQISRIACPIGDPTLGKYPQAIAVGVAARLISEHLLHDEAFWGT